jgi:hypothetical protein
MKKRALSLTLALILCLSLAVPVLAAEKTIYLDGYNSANNPVNSKVQEVDAENSQLSLTGDLTQTGEVELRGFSDSTEIYTCPVYTAKGAVEVLLTEGYEDDEAMGGVDEDGDVWVRLAIASVGIDTVTYDAAQKSAVTLKEQALYFDGKINCEIDGTEKTMSLKEFNETPDIWDRLSSIPCVHKGAKATLTEPGTYCVSAYYEAMEGGCIAYIIIPEGEDAKPDTPNTPDIPDTPAAAIPASGTSYASTQTVTVDGKAVEFQMYALKDEKGNPTNYIKLRDLAQILSGTEAQFAVGYDNAAKAISVTTGEAYTPNGSEMQTPFSGDRSYTGGAKSVTVDGEAVEMTAITLTDDAGGGYTYFKLRDLGKALGFNTGWTREQGVFVESNKPYTE